LSRQTANGYFFVPLRISRYEYAIASRLVFSPAVHSAIDVVEISENALANGLVIDGTAERITPEVDY
jgi:hypothetical protein